MTLDMGAQPGCFRVEEVMNLLYHMHHIFNTGKHLHMAITVDVLTASSHPILPFDNELTHPFSYL